MSARHLNNINAVIVQQPSQGRSCGVTNKVCRRLLEPALILRVDLEPDTIYSRGELSNIAASLLCTVVLVSAPDSSICGNTTSSSSAGYSTYTDGSMTSTTVLTTTPQIASLKSEHQPIPMPPPPMARAPVLILKSTVINPGGQDDDDKPAAHASMLGQLTINCRVLNDLVDGIPKLFFVFADLAVRTSGMYALQCTIIRMKPDVRIMQTLMTQPFEILVSSSYPGILDPTELTKCFYLQGVSTLRSGFHKKRKNGGKGK